MLYLIDISSKITDTVKQNCEKWFNNNMKTELIDEYYDSPIKFDKTHGNVVKVTSYNSSIESGKYNVILELKRIRFLKQKLHVEMSIELLEPYESDSDEDELFQENSDQYMTSDDEDCDFPEPIPEDIIQIRTRYIHSLELMKHQFLEDVEKQTYKIKTIQENIQEQQSEISDIEKMKMELNDITTIQELENMAERIQRMQV